MAYRAINIFGLVHFNLLKGKQTVYRTRPLPPNQPFNYSTIQLFNQSTIQPFNQSIH